MIFRLIFTPNHLFSFNLSLFYLVQTWKPPPPHCFSLRRTQMLTQVDSFPFHWDMMIWFFFFFPLYHFQSYLLHSPLLSFKSIVNDIVFSQKLRAFLSTPCKSGRVCIPTPLPSSPLPSSPLAMLNIPSINVIAL